MPEHDDKLVSDTYAALNRDAPVSPPPALDAAILAEAHRAVQSAPGPVQRRSPTWFAPFAVAATVVLTTTLLVLAPRQQPGELIPSAEQVQSPEPVSRKQSATALDSVPEPAVAETEVASGLQVLPLAAPVENAAKAREERMETALMSEALEENNLDTARQSTRADAASAEEIAGIAAEPADDVFAFRASPGAWRDKIVSLLASGDVMEADDEFELFREAHPDHAFVERYPLEKAAAVSGE